MRWTASRGQNDKPTPAPDGRCGPWNETPPVPAVRNTYKVRGSQVLNSDLTKGETATQGAVRQGHACVRVHVYGRARSRAQES